MHTQKRKIDTKPCLYTPYYLCAYFSSHVHTRKPQTQAHTYARTGSNKVIPYNVHATHSYKSRAHRTIKLGRLLSIKTFRSWFLIRTGVLRVSLSKYTVMPLSGRYRSISLDFSKSFDFSGAPSLAMAMVCQVSL